MNIKNQIKTLKEHINKLIILEKQKHLYFIDIYFKKIIYKTTTRETRNQYIKEFLKNSNSNYIANLIIYNNDKESYKVLINNYDKELIIKLCLRIADTIGQANRTYIKSTDKNISNINFYLTKILNHKSKFIIKNNIELNNIIYSKDKLNKLDILESKIKHEKDKTNKELLIKQKQELIYKSKQNIFNTIRKRKSFYKYDINKIQTINEFKELNKKNNVVLTDKEITDYVNGKNHKIIYNKINEQLIKNNLNDSIEQESIKNDLEIDERIEQYYNKKRKSKSKL